MSSFKDHTNSNDKQVNLDNRRISGILLKPINDKLAIPNKPQQPTFSKPNLTEELVKILDNYKTNHKQDRPGFIPGDAALIDTISLVLKDLEEEIQNVKKLKNHGYDQHALAGKLGCNITLLNSSNISSTVWVIDRFNYHSKLYTKLLSLQESYQKDQVYVGPLNKTSSDIRKELVVLKDAKEVLEGIVDKLKKENADLNVIIKNLRMSNIKITEQYTAIQADNKDLKQKYDHLEKTLDIRISDIIKSYGATQILPVDVSSSFKPDQTPTTYQPHNPGQGM